MTPKITDTEIKKLLVELAEYIPEIDPADDEWLEFLKNFIAARPDVKIDKKFQEELRAELLARAAQLDRPIIHERSHTGLWWKLGLTFAGGAAVCAAVVVPMLINTPTKVSSPRTEKLMARDAMSEMQMADVPIAEMDATNVAPQAMMVTNTADSTDDLSVVEIETVDDGSFDQIELQNDTAVEESKMAFGRGGGGGGMGVPSYYPGNGRINYEYKFDGTLPDIPSTLSVYKKSNDKMPSWRNQIGIGNLADLGSFGDLQVANISLRQADEKEPWNVYVDLRNGVISLNHEMNWIAQESRNVTPLTWEKAPTDAAIIRIARNFLNEHKIDISNLGEPKVEKWWEMNDQPRPDYMPDQITVLFPLQIEGQLAADQWGNSRGIRVSLDVRDEQVQYATMESLALQRSEYQSLSIDEILKQAESGGDQGVTYNNPDRTITVELGEPELRLVEIMSWRDPMYAETYYVPTLIFEPTTEREEGVWFPEKIIVPLARDLMAK